MAFASCAKDTVTEANRGMAIDFRVATQTRATEMDYEGLDEFAVTAISTTAVAAGTEGDNYFTGVTYTRGDGETFYLSDPVYYWPKEGALNFYAYSPVTLPGTIIVTKDGKTVTDFTPASDVSQQVDFITATATAAHSAEIETSGVALNFSHELTQIQVKAKNSNEGYIYTVKAFKIGNVAGKGKFDFTKEHGSRWDLTSTEVKSYEVEFNEVILSATATSFLDENNSAMLLPQNLTAWTNEESGYEGTYFAVLARIETSGGTVIYPKSADETEEDEVEGVAEGETETSEEKEFGWLAVGVDTEWVAGTKYVYTLDFSTGAGTPVDPEGTGTGTGTGTGELFGGPIKFTTTVSAWGTTDEITIEKEVTVPPVEDPTNNPAGDQQ